MVLLADVRHVLAGILRDFLAMLVRLRVSVVARVFVIERRIDLQTDALYQIMHVLIKVSRLLIGFRRQLSVQEGRSYCE